MTCRWMPVHHGQESKRPGLPSQMAGQPVGMKTGRQPTDCRASFKADWQDSSTPQPSPPGLNAVRKVCAPRQFFCHSAVLHQLPTRH